MSNLLYPSESNKLLGLAIQLHKELGCGFKEKVYQDAFEVLLNENKIPYEREKHICIEYHGVVLEHDFYYDYLHVGNHQLGLLLNFGSSSLQYKWIPNKPDYKK